MPKREFSIGDEAYAVDGLFFATYRQAYLSSLRKDGDWRAIHRVRKVAECSWEELGYLGMAGIDAVKPKQYLREGLPLEAILRRSRALRDEIPYLPDDGPNGTPSGPGPGRRLKLAA